MFLISSIRAFKKGWHEAAPHRLPFSHKVKQDKAVRDNMSDKQLDRMLKDTFPSSDAVAMY